MPLYKIGSSLQYLKEVPFKLEKEIQQLTEANLKTIFGLELIRSEFALNNFRIDTLAFDGEAQAFIIIEYKRDKNFSVIDQGYAYLSLMLNNKADFILEANEQQNQNLKRNDIDWSQSKVIFVSPHFTTYQREAINFKDLPIELWEVKRFENDTVSYEQIQKASSTESIKTISGKDETVKTVSKEVKVYTEQDHLQSAGSSTVELYEKLKETLLGLDDTVTLQPKKITIGFKVADTVFCDVVIQGKNLKIFLNMKVGELQDPQNLARDVSNVGHWGTGSYELKVSDLESMENVIPLVRQSLRRNKS